jgi:predicted transcriptional regulator
MTNQDQMHQLYVLLEERNNTIKNLEAQLKKQTEIAKHIAYVKDLEHKLKIYEIVSEYQELELKLSVKHAINQIFNK